MKSDLEIFLWAIVKSDIRKCRIYIRFPFSTEFCWLLDGLWYIAFWRVRVIEISIDDDVYLDAEDAGFAPRPWA